MSNRLCQIVFKLILFISRFSTMNRKMFQAVIVMFFSIAYNADAQPSRKDIVPSNETETSSNLITPFRIFQPSADLRIEYLDLDQDGDPDVLRSFTSHNIPVQWIDDDDDMQEGDIEGDLDSDCLMIDRNKDGKYGSGHDLIIDWNDEDGDNKPDLQVVADNSGLEDRGRFQAHYIWIIDTDHDQIFNYIDWHTFKLEGWEHAGRCYFFEDYIGQSIMLKSHTSTFNIKDLRYSWENPFLFFDPDDDGLTEMAIRLTDSPEIDMQAKPLQGNGNVTEEMRSFQFDGIISNAYITFDLDNDNAASKEFDFDMSLKFSGGKGFDYNDQIHKYESIKGLEGSEHFFYDARWRTMTELIYPDHDSAYKFVFQRGQWDECWLTYDEDDDCQRWERVELYSPQDPFNAGVYKGGLDNNAQADVSGDRGEWDLDFSGEGQLYIGPFDGRIHLYGAEWGCWRIDQNATYFQGWQGWRGLNIQPEDHITIEPDIFPTIMYTDNNNNGFFDHIHYDLDGDKNFERIVSLKSMGLADTTGLIQTADMKYWDFNSLYKRIAENIWENAMKSIEVAEKNRLNTGWYSNLMHPRCLRDKYHYGYWLNFYIYMDLIRMYEIKKDPDMIKLVDKAYFGRDWEILLKANQ